jgi:hypothetical protein
MLCDVSGSDGLFDFRCGIRANLFRNPQKHLRLVWKTQHVDSFRQHFDSVFQPVSFRDLGQERNL